MMNARSLGLLLILFGPLLWSGCLSDEEEDLVGNWIRRSDFEGVPRSNAVAFTIGSFAYVGTGFDGDDDLQDFWRYDPNTDFWTAVDDFPGIARRAAVAFSIGSMGYVGSGLNGDADEELADFWAFDPSAPAGSQWMQIADFPGEARYNAVAFSDDGRGFVGTGLNENWLKDFYAYDPITNTWEQIVSLGGSKRESATTFSIDGIHYVGTGRNNGTYETDFWAYDNAQGNWDRMLPLDEEDDYDITRHAAVGFTLQGKGYISTGSNGINLSSVWEYDPANDVWEEKTAFEGSSRSEAVAFVVDGRAFVTTGRNSSTRFDDLREFLPNEASDEDD
ncbi:MAG: galactose oxidase [Bacteroidota bacterium]